MQRKVVIKSLLNKNMTAFRESTMLRVIMRMVLWMDRSVGTILCQNDFWVYL